MDLLRSSIAAVVHRACFSPRPTAYTIDFEHKTSSSCPARLEFIPVTLEGISEAGINDHSWTCENFLVPCMLHRRRPSNKTTLPTRLLFVFHGMGANIGVKIDSFAEVCDKLLSDEHQNWLVVQVEVPGYGLCSPVARSCSSSNNKTGTPAPRRDIVLPPSPDSFRIVSRAVVKTVMSKLGVEAGNVVLCGRSMSSGVVLEMARQEQFGGICLLSPYTAISNVIYDVLSHRQGPSIGAVGRSVFDWMCHFSRTNFFDNLSNIAQVAETVPLQIVHGEQDDFVSVEHSKALVRAVPRATLHIDKEANHSTIKYETQLAAFLNTIAAKMVGEKSRTAVGEVEAVIGAVAIADKAAYLDDLAKDHEMLQQYRASRMMVLKILAAVVFLVCALTTGFAAVQLWTWWNRY